MKNPSDEAQLSEVIVERMLRLLLRKLDLLAFQPQREGEVLVTWTDIKREFQEVINKLQSNEPS